VSAAVRHRRRWRPRWTIRARLTATYTALVAAIGAVMLAVVYVFMRYVPNYQITAVPRQPVAATQAGGCITVTSSVEGELARPATLAVRSATDFLQLFLTVSLSSLLVLVVVGAVVGWVVAGRVLRPLGSINRAAQLAGTGSFDHRVAFDGPADEVRELADTFDEMLEKLDNSFQAHRRFAANASHELRTPLAAVHTMLQVALADADLDREALRDVAGRVYETNRRNIETVDSLLDLADIGQGTKRLAPVRLDQVAGDAVQEARAEAEARRVTIDLSLEPVTVLGDQVQLRQAMLNLVRNAVRHNVDGGHLTVATVTDGSGDAVARVTNTGRVVPEELLESLTEPFVRGVGRVSAPRGHGLGLTIAKSVATSHHGTLRLSGNPGGGLTVTVALPGPPEP
jgi:two-component system sensor histidine kinase VanS